MATQTPLDEESGVVMVTGAAQGIGLAIARAFGAKGRALAICDVDGPRLDQASAGLGELGGVVARRIDVTREHEVAGFVADVEDGLGPIDVLVNNAGLGGGGPSETYELAKWRRLIDVNLTAAFICAQTVGSRMLKRNRGVIVNVASIYGRRAAPERAAYVASKFGIIGLTEALAVEWGPHGVRVNAVAPGYVGTELFWAARTAEGDDLARVIARIPAGRIGEVDDVASAVVFLVSSEARYVTGHTLVVDGGWLPNGAAANPDEIGGTVR